MKLKKILITGGSGFLASNVADFFSEKGLNVTILDTKKSSFLKKKNQKQEICSILDKKKLIKNFKNHDIVLHFAASADLIKSNENHFFTIENNVLGTMNVLEACIKNNVKKIIYASSIYSMSEQGGFYSMSKLTSEMLIENYFKKFGLNYVILRFGSIYGLRANYFNRINNYIIDALKKKVIIRKSSGKEIRNYINVKDISKLTYEVLKDKHKNKYYNLFGGERTKVYQILKLIKKLLPETRIVYRKKDTLKYNYKVNPFSYKLRVGQNLNLNQYVKLEKGLKELIENIKTSNNTNNRK